MCQLAHDNLPFLQNNPELAMLEEMYNPSDTEEQAHGRKASKLKLSGYIKRNFNIASNF